MKVTFTKDLIKTKPKNGKGSSSEKKSDRTVREYCEAHPLNLATGTVHRLFYHKGEPLHPDLARLFSEGLPRNGMVSMKSILYGHVLSPTTKMNRREMFMHKSDDEVYNLKHDIVESITDPFWKRIEDQNKFGSYDWHGYASLVPHISAQYGEVNDAPVPEWVLRGIRAAVEELDLDVTPISLEESISYCRMDTNSGFPCFTSKPITRLCEDGTSYEVLDREKYDTYVHIAKSVWEGKAHTNLPAILFKRIQPGHETESKARIVECISRGILWAEGRIWRPILEQMRKLPCYYGYMHWSNGMSSVIEDALTRDHVSSLDYSGYDQAVGRFLRPLFEALAERIPSAAPLFEWCAEYYPTAPLLTPHGYVEGRHGLLSGMFGTSFAGSIINRGLILGMEMALRDEGHTISRPCHLSFGDDTAYAWDGDVSIEMVISKLRDAGMTLNADKQEYCGPGDVDKFIMFQACYWRHNPGCDDHCVPVYSLVRCAARLAFIEYMDAPSKLVYGAGKRIDDIECPEVIGLIVGSLISKLCEAGYHPNIMDFIGTYQGTWLHNLNPLQCVTDDRVLRFVRNEFSYAEETEVGDFLSHPVVERLLAGLKVINVPTREEITVDELRRAASARTSHRHTVSPPLDEKACIEELTESVIMSGLSEGLIDSILRRLPLE